MKTCKDNTIQKTINIYVSPMGNDAWSGLSSFFVSNDDGPLFTIDAAIQKVYTHYASIHSTHDVKENNAYIIWLEEGTYFIDRPIEINTDICANLTIKSYGKQRAIIDGGKKIEGWQRCRVNEKEAWCADAKSLGGTQMQVLQLFVNGKRASRPRLPKSGFYTVRDPLCEEENLRWGVHSNTFGFHEGNLKNWRNLSEVEVVLLHFWAEERLPIQSVNEQNNEVTFSRYTIGAPCRAHPAHHSGNALYYVENVFEALTEPGEWYFDQLEEKIYYIPFEDENIEITEIYTAPLMQLLRIVGNAKEGKYINNVTFEGIELRHSGLLYPATIDTTSAYHMIRPWNFRVSSDALPLAGNSQGAPNVPGAVYFEGARNCIIRNCKIWHIGWYGIDIADGCSGIIVENTEITDVGAGGIKISGENTCEEHAYKTEFNTIMHCHLHDLGKVFHNAVGILLQYSSNNTISNNHIHDLFYTGISVGWGWLYTERACYENLIEHNHIHHIGKGYLSDMGGIYTLSCQLGTVIRHNHIHDIECAVYGANAIYLDDGTSHILVENNLCYRTNTDIINIKGRENIIRNNIFAFGKKGVVKLCETIDKYNVFYFIQNIVLCNDCAAYRFNYGIDMSGKLFFSAANLFYNYGEKALYAEQLLAYGANNKTMPLIALLNRDHMDIGSIFENPLLHNPLNDDFTISESSPSLKMGFGIFDASGQAEAEHTEVKNITQGHIE